MNSTQKTTTTLQTVVIRLAGDSGDGIQISGNQLTNTSAVVGNDVHTFSDFPAEIRAPAGTLAGISGFQLKFSEHAVHTPGDELDMLVAMNPAALKVNIADLKPNGHLIINTTAFNQREFNKAKYASDPLQTGELAAYQCFEIPITDLTLKAVAEIGLTHAQAKKCKNLYALGIIYWLYNRPLSQTLQWLAEKYKNTPEIVKGNQQALSAGYNYALTTELFAENYSVPKADLKPGYYRQVTGNEALALGCVAVAVSAQRPMLLAGYPITPASIILQIMAHYSQFGITTFQAEDEIAAICAAVGAAFGGSLALTTTSGPGFDLKTEGMGLAMIAELPLVVINVQRAGPSTGLPTKTEQADLLAAMYGRHGECPIPIIAAKSPGDCFDTVIEAFRIALKYMTPVIILSDGSLATSTEPWLIPDTDKLPKLKPEFYTDSDFQPYQRDPQTLARQWAIPGTKGLEHRIGGLEKENITGNVSYDPENHQKMLELRLNKIIGIANDIPQAVIIGNRQAKLLV